jgi:hypothetical protein
VSSSNGRWKMAWNAPVRTAARRPEVSFHTKKQVAPPADLFAKKDDGEDDGGYGDVENGPAEARRQALKWDYPKAAATPKLTAMITTGPTTAISSPRPLRGLNPTPAQTARR